MPVAVEGLDVATTDANQGVVLQQRLFEWLRVMRSKVLLPQPEGPTKTTNSPCAISRSIPWMTVFLPS